MILEAHADIVKDPNAAERGRRGGIKAQQNRAVGRPCFVVRAFIPSESHVQGCRKQMDIGGAGNSRNLGGLETGTLR